MYFVPLNKKHYSSFLSLLFFFIRQLVQLEFKCWAFWYVHHRLPVPRSVEIRHLEESGQVVGEAAV